MRSSRQTDVSLWGLSTNRNGDVSLHGALLSSLAVRYGTPLHVVDRERLHTNAHSFVTGAQTYLGAQAAVHFACKCNGVPGVLAEIRQAGANIEVMSTLELRTAQAVGFTPGQIIVNGPCKSTAFLRESIVSGVQLIIVDSIAELERLDLLARDLDTQPHVLLRINPDIRVRGLNRGSSTGRRQVCAFGLDLEGGEVETALRILRPGRIVFRGFHAHIGTGIRHPKAYRRLVRTFRGIVSTAASKGFSVSVLDVGGGFPSATSREFSTSEFLRYQATGKLPPAGPTPPPLDTYFDAIATALRSSFGSDVPESIILEPGRSIVSNAQHLLLSVEYIKRRSGTETWVITDGGLGTVTLPTYYEYHEIIPCTSPLGPDTEPVTILGPGCFAADVVVRNKSLPALVPGDVLAVMDAGAYFTAMESNFGYPRPAIVAVDTQGVSLWRHRESFDEFIQRDETSLHNYTGVL